ncbi:MAG: hypothetical protein ACRC7O_04825, partial [Fimbriiglobus sp.]
MADFPADRHVPRVVFFGPPFSGKSALISAFLRATDPTADDAIPLTLAHPGNGVRRELVTHRLSPTAATGGAVEVCDCDGKAAGELLTHPDGFVRASSAGGALATAVRAADSLVLVVDAAASAADIDDLFGAFGRFLESLEEGRTFGREVGGLPVFLTLTKCDALIRPDDEPTDWLARVESRKSEVRGWFEDFFGDDIADADSPFLAFGTIDLHLAATAVTAPTGPMFTAYADPAGAFGVADLLLDVTAAARAYRRRV